LTKEERYILMEPMMHRRFSETPQCEVPHSYRAEVAIFLLTNRLCDAKMLCNLTVNFRLGKQVVGTLHSVV